MSEARVVTEAFRQFLSFETSFTAQFKTSIAAIHHTKMSLSQHDSVVTVASLIKATNQQWSLDFDSSRVTGTLDDSIRLVTLFAIVQIHSAIEDFITTLDADLSRCTAVLDLAPSPQAIVDTSASTPIKDVASNDPNSMSPEELISYPERLEKFCLRHGWDCGPFDVLGPVLRYFVQIRNCVVHRSGKAGNEMAAVSAARELSLAYSEWPTLSKRKPLPSNEKRKLSPPSLAVFSDGEAITLTPRYVILLLEAAHRATAHLTREFIKHVGTRGLVFLAAHYSLLAPDRLPITCPERAEDPEDLIHLALREWYNFSGVTPSGIVRHLQAINKKWNLCVSAFVRYYPKSVSRPALQRNETVHKRSRRANRS